MDRRSFLKALGGVSAAAVALPLLALRSRRPAWFEEIPVGGFGVKSDDGWRTSIISGNPHADYWFTPYDGGHTLRGNLHGYDLDGLPSVLDEDDQLLCRDVFEMFS